MPGDVVGILVHRCGMPRWRCLVSYLRVYGEVLS